MSNFTFIKTDFPELHTDVIEAEQLVFISSKASAVLSRSVLENAVNWLYENERKLERPWRADLSTLMHGDEFKALFNRTMFGELNLIRKIGNAAAHASTSKRTSSDDALASLKYLFRFLRFLAIYYGKTTPETQVFDDALIPRSAEKEKAQAKANVSSLLADIEAKNKTNRAAEKKILEQAQENALLKQQLEQQLAELANRKVEREKTVDIDTAIPLEISEKETRKRYIDLALKEAGWTNLQQGHDIEFPVVGMPKITNASGKGYVDYVLWGDDGLPLAVVEAKKTMDNPKKGKHQAELYADCLESMKGQRPIIFYTNGFETYLWDDQFSPEREVQGFYSKDELSLLIKNRDPKEGRQDLRTFKVNQEIAGKGRPYQLEAIARVAENSVKTVNKTDTNGNTIEVLRSGSRQSLLVMATGSGKTRVSAAITDMMTKCNWAKRILFLADRNALVTQAKNNFNDYLPHLSAIDLTKEKEDDGTRIVFSTYPTIMNRIDGTFSNGKGNDDERFYGVGHFDLIIIDEAHRSVYQKYKAIFNYFDAMLIGLTATPKNEVGHDTYGLFGIEDDNPTFSYELDTAVKEGFLVPPKAMSVPLKFVREGIKYNELSEEEQKQYEDTFGDPTTDEAPDGISSAAINSWLFNTHTVDQVLNHLMTNGIKVQGGDKLGKTIIFAKSHDHAIFIEERFNKNYPEYAGKFLRVIDNYESKAQDLLDVFVDEYEENDPQIAVSVDMMDTGVDAPRVVNLVFFKQVKSSTKFWQMIGRGTRLCKGLFGLNQDGTTNDKKEFVIFDYCENFEFFNANPNGATGNVVKSLTQQAFEAKLEISLIIRETATSTDEQRALAESYISELNLAVAALNTDRFSVKAKLRAVTEFSNKERWRNIGKNDMLDINTNISALILPVKDDDEFARRFDVLILNFQLALLTAAHSTERYVNKISGIARDLLKKQNIPAIGLQAPLLSEIQTLDFWKVINVNRLDNVRVSLRDLLKYLDKDKQVQVITTFEDELNHSGIEVHDLIPAYTAMQSYKDRVESYVRKHNDHLVIRKLKTNKPITETEINELEQILFDGKTVGTKQEYIDTYGDRPLGEFIRSIVGLDAGAAQAVFADFIQAGNLTPNQMTFINNIISYLTQNGTIEKKMLFEPPFTNLHDQGLFGVFDNAQVTNVINLIDTVNDNVIAADLGAIA